MRISLVLLILIFTQQLGAQTKLRVFTLSPLNLQMNKERITHSALSPAYKQLLKDAKKALEFGPVSVMEKKNMPPSGDKHDYMSLAPYYWPDPSKPDGLPYIRKDGETNPEVKEYKDKEYLPKLCESVYTLALAYYFSEDGMYAEHASKLLRVWFLDTATKMNPNLNFGQAMKGTNTGRGAGLIDTRHLIKVVDAIGLLQGSKHWKAADQKGLQIWFSDFLNWMQTSVVGRDEMDAPNNHGAWYDAQRLSFALFIDSTRLAKEISQSALQRLNKQMDASGRFPLEMQRTTSLHYSVFVLDAFVLIDKMADWKGNAALKKGIDTMLPYLMQEKQWDGQQIKDFNYEEAIPVLNEASWKYDCKKCDAAIKKIAGEKYERLRIHLMN